jgi:hypothetical protein
MIRIRLFFFLLLFPFFLPVARCQDLFLKTTDPGINELLDELAEDHVISLVSVIKPYSWALVTAKLEEALRKDSLLTPRQAREARFYLANFPYPAAVQEKDSVLASVSAHSTGVTFPYNPVSIQFRSKNFLLSLRPLVGYTQLINNNASVYSLGIGTGAYAYAGRHLAFAAGIRKVLQNQQLVNPKYFVPDEGGKWHNWADGGGWYADWFGQVTWSWKWGSLGAFRDRIEWGNNYHGATVFSSKPPAFPFVQLKANPAKWIGFTYIQGWLKSDVIDSSQGTSGAYIGKHIAANMLTITPWKRLNISLGNSIIYDGGFKAAYLIPVLFFKSVDHTLSNTIDNENSQMFFDISSRQIRHLHLFLTLFIDEFMFSRLQHPDEHNFLSWKTGFGLTDFPFRNTTLIVEGTRTLPMTYQHYIPTLTFTSQNYNFGNYIRDNSQEIYVEIRYKPLDRLHFSLSYNFAEHGDNYVYGEVENPTTVPVLQNITWKSSVIALNASYDLASNVNVFIGYRYSDVSGEADFTPPLYYGKTGTLSLGFVAGF